MRQELHDFGVAYIVFLQCIILYKSCPLVIILIQL